MPRTPNYRFEKQERERKKAEKKAARAATKAVRKVSENPDVSSQDVTE